MIASGAEYGVTPELTAEMVRAQLDLLTGDEGFRSSRRSVAFLRYVVEQTLNGAAGQIKERTIGVDVFGRDPEYDTNLDHIVRTAATELRKKLATYYVDERHRSELHIALLPGSYIPKFSLPGQGRHLSPEMEAEAEAAETLLEAHGVQLVPVHPVENGVEPDAGASRRRRGYRGFAIVAVILLAAVAGYGWFMRAGPEELFWRPVLKTPGPVLVVVGDHPNGPPTLPNMDGKDVSVTPVPGSDAGQTVPFADTVTTVRVAGALEAQKKQVLIRLGSNSTFSDLRGGAVVLIGAFNNEWSLRLTRQLRFSLAMDPRQHLIYIHDAKNPASRNWSWATNQPSQITTGANSPKLRDFALISRFRDVETGHTVVVIGGLYTYGTEAAGEFLSDPALMGAVAREMRRSPADGNLQIVLGTTVTDGVPGTPELLAVSTE